MPEEELVTPEVPATEPEEAVVTASQLLDQVLLGAEAYQDLRDAFIGQFVFEGQTLQEWANEMEVEIPMNLTPAQFRNLLAELAGKCQRCHSNFSIANAMYKALHGGGHMRKADLIALLVEQFGRQNKKRPAGAVLEKMADSLMKNTVSSAVAAAIVKDFWSDRIESLDRTRKVLESLGMSQNTEVKWLSQ